MERTAQTQNYGGLSLDFLISGGKLLNDTQQKVIDALDDAKSASESMKKFTNDRANSEAALKKAREGIAEVSDTLAELRQNLANHPSLHQAFLNALEMAANKRMQAIEAGDTKVPSLTQMYQEESAGLAPAVKTAQAKPSTNTEDATVTKKTVNIEQMRGMQINEQQLIKSQIDRIYQAEEKTLRTSIAKAVEALNEQKRLVSVETQKLQSITAALNKARQTVTKSLQLVNQSVMNLTNVVRGPAASWSQTLSPYMGGADNSGFGII